MAEAPENSLASYRAAEQIGVDEVETDVRISADGQLFMLHDATLDRVAADASGRGLGEVAGLPWSVISAVDIGGGERVPTLEQLYAVTTRPVQLEIKALEAIGALADYFGDHPADARRTILTSFSVTAMARASELLPDIPRGVIVSAWTDAVDHAGGPEGLIKETGSVRIHSGWEGLTAEVVSELHQAGVPVHGWPCRDRADLLRALELGLDGTTSDDPRTVRFAAGWRTDPNTRLGS
jgi:glycerophosphoryl diester phosphodiesterase